MDQQYKPPERAPAQRRRAGCLTWLRTALQVIQTAAILFRTWYDL